jgi:hypothetical protein
MLRYDRAIGILHNNSVYIKIFIVKSEIYIIEYKYEKLSITVILIVINKIGEIFVYCNIESSSCIQLLHWKSNKHYLFRECFCNCSYPACSECAHAPYCIAICDLPTYIIYPHYLINDTSFERRTRNVKCVLIFTTIFVWNSFIQRRTLWDVTTNMYWCSCKVQ